MKEDELGVLNKTAFSEALTKIAKASPEASRAAVESANATKPSLHTRFVYDPAKS